MSLPNQPLPALFIVFPLFLFVGMWLGVSALLAELSGWPELAREFPAGERRPDGTRLRRQVVKTGLVSENGVTVLVLSTLGLYLEAPLPFRFRRPPVLVPWGAVRYVSERRFLWQRWHVFDLAGITTIGVKPPAAEAMGRFLAGGSFSGISNSTLGRSRLR